MKTQISLELATKAQALIEEIENNCQQLDKNLLSIVADVNVFISGNNPASQKDKVSIDFHLVQSVANTCQANLNLFELFKNTLPQELTPSYQITMKLVDLIVAAAKDIIEHSQGETNVTSECTALISKFAEYRVQENQIDKQQRRTITDFFVNLETKLRLHEKAESLGPETFNANYDSLAKTTGDEAREYIEGHIHFT